jgi:L-threonylcarbamoyladenylate synthase
MLIISKTEFNKKYKRIIEEMKNCIFIHPTDTIYGIGCDATNKELVEKIRIAKKRPNDPFSVIAPSREWIIENAVMNKKTEEWLNKLPGPYTLIIKLKNKNAVAENVNPGMDTLGIRIPDHWFSEAVEKMNVPVITTSANPSGEEFMIEIEDLHKDLKNICDYAFYEGPKKGRPSDIINLEKEKIEIKKR